VSRKKVRADIKGVVEEICDEKPASREIYGGVIGLGWAEPGHPERFRLAGIIGAKIPDLH
jgi:hypothetical protein